MKAREAYERKIEEPRTAREEHKRQVDNAGYLVAGIFGAMLGAAAIFGVIQSNVPSRYESQSPIVRIYDLNRDGKLSSAEHIGLTRDLELKFIHRASQVENWE
jgi:hypothetical protein